MLAAATEIMDQSPQSEALAAQSTKIAHRDASDAVIIDPSLVIAARCGDRAAFARLHQCFAPMVHGILLSRVPRQDADDLTQEVFLHAMQKLPSLKDHAAVGPWLAAVARSFAASFHRGRRTHQPMDPSIDRPLSNAREGSTTEALAVLNAIQNLPEAYAETLVLRLVEGLTGPQIAACTGLAPGSVRVNLHRGMQMLRAKLDQLNPGGSTP
jgi:RNA polymerase sigma-70 factor (ECF subfamily)